MSQRNVQNKRDQFKKSTTAIFSTFVSEFKNKKNFLKN